MNATWITCSHCGKLNAEGKRFCGQCGARLGERTTPASSKQDMPTMGELQEAWQAVRVRRDLRSSGAWNVLMGILILGAGATYIQGSSCNAALFAIGLLLIGTGIALWSKPSPATSLLSAIAMLLAALWNAVLFVVAIAGSDPSIRVVGGPAFFVPILFAVMYFRTHARFMRTQHVSPRLITDLDRETRQIQKAKLAAGDDLIAFRARGRNWKGRLGAERVTLVTRNGGKACFASPDEFVIAAPQGIAQGRRGRVTIQAGTEAWTGQAPYESLARYERWKATRQTPPTASRSPSQDTALYQETIGLLQQIADHAGPAQGDASQEERLARLVRMGPAAVPAAVGAVWSVLRYGGHDAPRLENAGRLCEAIGRMGSDKALEALAGFATRESSTPAYQHVRVGAIRGLGHLNDQRAGQTLRGLLEDPDAQIREAAGLALGAGRSVEVPGQRDAAQAAATDGRAQVTLPAGPPNGGSAAQAATANEKVQAAGAGGEGAAKKPIGLATWIGVGGAVVYVVLVALVFFVPQVPFCAGSAMLLPTVIGLILMKMGTRGYIKGETGCMLILASTIGGLILYGLLWLFQRQFLLNALESF
jgi:hypothetical protein